MHHFFLMHLPAYGYQCAANPHNPDGTYELQCPLELTIAIKRASAGINAKGCNWTHACCLPGKDHEGGCCKQIMRRDPRLFEHKKRCDGQVKCTVDMVSYVECEMGGVTKRSAPDFQFLFYTCIKRSGSQYADVLSFEIKK